MIPVPRMQEYAEDNNVTCTKLYWYSVVPCTSYLFLLPSRARGSYVLVTSQSLSLHMKIFFPVQLTILSRIGNHTRLVPNMRKVITAHPHPYMHGYAVFFT